MAAEIQISNADLDRLLAEVETDLQKSLQEEMALRKGEGSGSAGGSAAPPIPEGSSSGGSSGGSSASSGGSSGGSSASAGGSPDGAPPDAGAPPPDAGAGAPPPDGGAVASDEQQVIDEPDVGAMTAEMLQLPPKHLEAVFMAAKSALEQMASAAPGAGASAPAPSASPSAPPPGAGAPGAGPSPLAASEGGKNGQPVPPTKVPAGNTNSSTTTGIPQKVVKGEGSASASETGGIDRLHEAMSKSEARTAELEQEVALLTQVVDRVLGTPIRKSLSGISQLGFVPRAGEGAATSEVANLSKSEITRRLTAVCGNPELKKSDRQLVNQFYEGTIPVEGIAHLLR